VSGLIDLLDKITNYRTLDNRWNLRKRVRCREEIALIIDPETCKQSYPIDLVVPLAFASGLVSHEIAQIIKPGLSLGIVWSGPIRQGAVHKRFRSGKGSLRAAKGDAP
jgi:hypothetical protein